MDTVRQGWRQMCSEPQWGPGPWVTCVWVSMCETEVAASLHCWNLFIWERQKGQSIVSLSLKDRKSFLVFHYSLTFFCLEKNSVSYLIMCCLDRSLSDWPCWMTDEDDERFSVFNINNTVSSTRCISFVCRCLSESCICAGQLFINVMWSFAYFFFHSDLKNCKSENLFFFCKSLNYFILFTEHADMQFLTYLSL